MVAPLVMGAAAGAAGAVGGWVRGKAEEEQRERVRKDVLNALSIDSITARHERLLQETAGMVAPVITETSPQLGPKLTPPAWLRVLPLMVFSAPAVRLPAVGQPALSRLILSISAAAMISTLGLLNSL